MTLWPKWYRPPGCAALMPKVDIARRMIRYAAGRLDEPVSDVVSERRGQNLVHARAVVAMALKERGWSYPRIGTAFNRDHSSIIHAVQSYDLYVRRNPQLDAVLTGLRFMSGHDRQDAA